MRSFEKCLRDWEGALSRLDPKFTGSCTIPSEVPVEYAEYHAAAAALIDNLFHLEQQYPPARLHDCRSVLESGSPQIILGKSNLAPFE